MGQKILVTGGAGFIGANLVRRLREGGFEEWVFDDLSRGRVEYLPGAVRLIQGDIRDHEALYKAMSGIETVIHLAAFGSVVESVDAPQPNFDINVSGTLSVLECARKAGVGRLIFASTGGALIGEAMPPVDELSLPKPISPYGASKLCGEAYCHAYAKAYGICTIALRFANVYGPFSGHKKGAATKFMKCLLQSEPMSIFGDGSASRDFLHVADLCEGIVKAIELDVSPGEVFHLASEEETTILGLAKAIAEIGGAPDHPIQYFQRRAGEVTRNFAKSDKAHKALGFKPQKNLMKGLEETWKWYLAHRDDVLSLKESDS